jgi:hypothetical protein
MRASSGAGCSVWALVASSRFRKKASRLRRWPASPSTGRGSVDWISGSNTRPLPLSLRGTATTTSSTSFEHGGRSTRLRCYTQPRCGVGASA